MRSSSSSELGLFIAVLASIGDADSYAAADVRLLVYCRGSQSPRRRCALLGESFGIFYPTTAHRLVKVRIRLKELRLRRDVREFRVEQGLLGGSNLQVDRRTFAIA